MNIDRRDALAGMVAMFGASLFAPIARAAAGADDADQRRAAERRGVHPPQRALMTALSERVMPTTDTPGAITAGVPEFIEKLLADWAAARRSQADHRRARRDRGAQPGRLQGRGATRRRPSSRTRC